MCPGCRVDVDNDSVVSEGGGQGGILGSGTCSMISTQGLGGSGRSASRAGLRKVFNDKPAQAWAAQEGKTLWRLLRRPSPAVSVCVLSLYQSPFSVSTTFVRLASSDASRQGLPCVLAAELMWTRTTPVTTRYKWYWT